MQHHRGLGFALVLACLPASALAQDGSQVFIPQVQQFSGSSKSPSTTMAYEQIYQQLSKPADVNGGPHNSNTSLAAAVAGANASSFTPAQTNNLAVLNQIGNGNTGDITQTGLLNSATTNVMGDRNTTSQNQVGAANQSTIGVTGDANTVTSNQLGLRNTNDITFTGSGDTVASTQIGIGLNYSLSSKGVDALASGGKTITVRQVGVR